jgi:HlyD family secretion protein
MLAFTAPAAATASRHLENRVPDTPPSLLRRWRWPAALVLVGLLAAGTWEWNRRQDIAAAPGWRTAALTRGPITASVSATGTLNAEVTVPVGSQVSGQVKELFADFNAEVRKGQLIARIDPETFEYRVRQAQADVDAARAQVLNAQAGVSAASAMVSRVSVNLAEARRDLDRKQQLVERNFISGAELDKARAVMDAAVEELRSARAQVEVAQAQTGSARAVVAQREAQLQQARVDLERTAIRAPVDGVVIKRSIDAGQTVAASLQSPELFVIARNLRDMQVETSIDEAEIGRIRVGQRATFTVDSYPGRSFSGEVRQVRKAALTVQNVVTYTVVVATPNPDLALIPGMTANVRVITDTRESVLKVPNAALRFRPPNWQEPPPGGAPAGAPAGAPKAGLGPWEWPGSVLSALREGLGALITPALAQSPGSGGPLAQFRERLERELSLSDDQKTRLDGIFGAMRERFAAARAAPDDERPVQMERLRAELRERIAQILTPDQKKRYQEMLADIGARQGAGTAAAPPGPNPAAAGTGAGQPAPGTASGKGPGASPGSAPGATPGATPGAAPGSAPGAVPGGGSPLQQFRARLERDIAFSNDQRVQLDAIFAAMRDKFAAVREAPEAERGKLVERNRAEMRERIGDILTAAQKPVYAAIIAEIAGRQASRGRIFLLGADGKPRAVSVRTGLTDGAFTEVSGEGLAEGDSVIIGQQGAATAPAARPAGAAPRLPF